MANRRYAVGEEVLASRDESGENHEVGTVRDFYELLIGDENRPTIVVEFADGERKYLTATEPNVRPIEDGDTDDEPGESAAGEAGDDDRQEIDGEQ